MKQAERSLPSTKNSSNTSAGPLHSSAVREIVEKREETKSTNQKLIARQEHMQAMLGDFLGNLEAQLCCAVLHGERFIALTDAQLSFITSTTNEITELRRRLRRPKLTLPPVLRPLSKGLNVGVATARDLTLAVEEQEQRVAQELREAAVEFIESSENNMDDFERQYARDVLKKPSPNCLVDEAFRLLPSTCAALRKMLEKVQHDGAQYSKHPPSEVLVFADSPSSVTSSVLISDHVLFGPEAAKSSSFLWNTSLLNWLGSDGRPVMSAISKYIMGKARAGKRESLLEVLEANHLRRHFVVAAGSKVLFEGAKPPGAHGGTVVLTMCRALEYACSMDRSPRGTVLSVSW